MKNLKKLSVLFVSFVIMGMSLASCGDDEPILSNNVEKTELTSPLFLFEKPSTDLASTIVKGFTFWSFTDDKAAECSIVYLSGKPHLRCNKYVDNWSIADGKITLGSNSSSFVKGSALGVKAYVMGTTIYFASNMNVAGLKAEDLFTKGYTKAQLWAVIDKAKTEAQPVPLEKE